MKKIILMLLALAMLFTLVACGSTNKTEAAPAEDQGEAPAAEAVEAEPAEEVEAEPAEEAEEVAEEIPAEAGGASGEPSASREIEIPEIETAAVEPMEGVEPLTINFNATYSEAEANGRLLQQFATFLDEITQGAIQVNFMWGGTVYTDATQFTALRDGAIDMISIQTTASADYVPYMSFSHYGVGDGQHCVQLWNEVMFENEETAALITAEAEQNNIKYLNAMDMGSDVIVSKFDWSTLDELANSGTVMGAGDYAHFEAMGMTCTFVVPPEAYDALQRGICDSSTLSLAGAYSMSWFEVADNVVMDGLRGTGGCLTVNLNWWNGLTDAQREAIQKAADLTADYSVQMNDSMESVQIAEIEESTGKPVKYLSEEDATAFYGYVFDSNARTCLSRVANDADKTAGMTRILQYVADYYGVDWAPEA